MTEQEFHATRKPLYLDSETLLVKFPTSKHMNTSHAQWFSEIPNVNVSLFSYLFEYFPTIKWIGLGCYKGQIGEIWKPKLVVTRP